MTVGELIDKLNKMPKENEVSLEVLAKDSEGWARTVVLGWKNFEVKFNTYDKGETIIYAEDDPEEGSD